MSDKMRRYIPVIAFWILVILPAFHFALAAPVAVREILEVRSNSVGVLKDGIAAWEKRMDFGDDDRWSANDGYQSKADDAGSNDDRGNAPDHAGDEKIGENEDMESWSSEQMGSDGRGPDPNYLRLSDSEEDPGNKHDGGKDNDNNSDLDSDSAKAKGGHISDDNESGYEADYDSDGEHGKQSSYGSNSPSPQSEHPASPAWSPEPWAEPVTYLEDLFKGPPTAVFRPGKSTNA
jgi:hypothetical protein